jgi:hypothetical protein
MFEVIVTFRANYTEQVVGRFPNSDEAQAAARLLAVQRPGEVVRAWVRQVRPATAGH